MIISMINTPRFMKYPVVIAHTFADFKAKRLAAISLLCIFAVLIFSYVALVTFATNSIYQAKSLKAAIKKSEDELVRNQSKIIDYLKSANPAVSESIKAMQDATVGISYVHTNKAIVDASRPQP